MRGSIAGTSRAEFIDELARRRIPVVQVTAEELSEEVEAAWQAEVARRVADVDQPSLTLHVSYGQAGKSAPAL